MLISIIIINDKRNNWIESYLLYAFLYLKVGEKNVITERIYRGKHGNQTKLNILNVYLLYEFIIFSMERLLIVSLSWFQLPNQWLGKVFAYYIWYQWI